MGHNHTAYAPEDVEDSRRGAPATSLESWAAARQLTFRGQELAGAFVQVLPRFKEYQFNVCRGEVVPGRYGQVAHDLEELEASEGELREGGSWYGTRLTTRRGLKSFIGLGDDRPDEPFAANAAWAPTTKVVVRVPEVALLPRVAIRNADRMTLGSPKLDEVGLPGFGRYKSRWIDDALHARVGTAARPLADIDAPYVAMVIEHGLLAVQRNGFVSDDAELDALVEAAGRIADALADGAGTAAPFDEPLPPPDRSTPPGFLLPQEHEVDVFQRSVAEFGMTEEDPVALHQAFPRLPFPGRALGVLAGTVRGADTFGRVVFAVQGGRTSGTYRTAVLLPAAPGAETPVGGAFHEPTDQYAEVSDGIAVCWPRVRSVGRLDAAVTIEKAITTLRDLDLRPT